MALTRIVTHSYRPKPPPRKKAKAAAIAGPAIGRVASKQEVKAFFARIMRRPNS
jgi:hypothetical protein